VLKDGGQDILIGANGIATGGNFSVNDTIHPGHLSSMVIPADVVGIWAADRPNYNITRVLQLLPEGMLVGITGKKDALTLKTGSLDVGNLATLTTIVTHELATAVTALAPNEGQTLDLNLFTQCACNNAGVISASGNLLINSKTTIVNSGTISALGNVTLTGVPGRDLLINNVDGLISAAGDINFRLPNYSASRSLEVAGGILEVLNDESRINVNGGNGDVSINVEDIIGIVQGRSGSAVITTTVSTGLLEVGTFTASRGGITLSGAGAVAINPDNETNHVLSATRVGDIQITAHSGDITLGNSTEISTAGGNIIILASGNVSGGTGMTLTAHAADAPGNSGNFDSGGIQIGAGLTSGSDLEHLIATRPASFEIQPTGLDPSSIGITTLNNNGVGLLQVNQNGGAINLGGSTVNIFGGVLLLETAGSGQITTGPSTFSSFIPVSYMVESPAAATSQEESVVDTGADDPGAFDDEVVASQ